ncbi:hypothetical protein NSK_006811 [Nannochloropsis salina CCMP1776]|uniref:BZIP domain-containing protein n=1 Tax=Nannochloropsis salina CCMP1776 TaxID=1027361 RepID=A0A4D9CQZ9_9STRA|nr:hypothetical protein NSK_006811 [Nannochloropsis salina CCMP1776]|eukprot:TFJ81560.1 hypothetical protein NSK_006811 [Nannochloropsis salina CCMP1776]
MATLSKEDFMDEDLDLSGLDEDLFIGLMGEGEGVNTFMLDDVREDGLTCPSVVDDSPSPFTAVSAAVATSFKAEYMDDDQSSHVHGERSAEAFDLGVLPESIHAQQQDGIIPEQENQSGLKGNAHSRKLSDTGSLSSPHGQQSPHPRGQPIPRRWPEQDEACRQGRPALAPLLPKGAACTKRPLPRSDSHTRSGGNIGKGESDIRRVVKSESFRSGRPPPLSCFMGPGADGEGGERSEKPQDAKMDRHTLKRPALEDIRSTPSSCSSSSTSTGSSHSRSGGNEDAELTSALAALERQGLAPQELKKQRRLIKNRMASQQHRERQKQQLEHLQASLAAKEEEIMALRVERDVLRTANGEMKKELASLRHALGVPGPEGGGGGLGSEGRGGRAGGWHASPSLSSLSEGTTSSESEGSASSPPPSLTNSPRTRIPQARVSKGAEARAEEWGREGRGGGVRAGGLPLFGALFLFTFLAAPSTFLLGNFRRDTSSSRFGGFLGESTLPSASLAGPLVTVHAVKDLTVPWLAASWAENRPAAEGAAGGEKAYLIDPVERQPHKWLAVGGQGTGSGGKGGKGREGGWGGHGAPWRFGESFELRVGAGGGRGGGKGVVRNETRTTSPPPSAPASTPPTRLRKQERAKAQLKSEGGKEGGVEGVRSNYPLTEDAAKQVDFYTGRDGRGQHGKQVAAREGGREEGGAFGVMGHDLSSGYLAGVEQLRVLREGGKEGGREGGPTASVWPRNSTLVVAEDDGEKEGEARDEGHGEVREGGKEEGGKEGRGGGKELDASSQLYFLLPAHTLDWAGQVPEETASSREGRWLEVGCGLTSVRIVKDVSFAGTGATA